MRRISSVFSEALGRPIGQGCWVDPMLGGRANTLGDVEAECPPEHHDRARLGTTVVGDATGDPDEGVMVRGRTRTEGRAPMLALAGILLLVFAMETARELADAEPGQGVIMVLVYAVAEALVGAYLVAAVALVVGAMVYLSAYLRGVRTTFPEAINRVVVLAAVAALLVVYLS